MKKKLLLLLSTVILLTCAVFFVSCGPQSGDECAHDWQSLDDEYENTSCIGEYGVYFECAICHEHKNETRLGSGHTIVDGKCQNCKAGLKFEENPDGTLRVIEFNDPIFMWGEEYDELNENEKKDGHFRN